MSLVQICDAVRLKVPPEPMCDVNCTGCGGFHRRLFNALERVMGFYAERNITLYAQVSLTHGEGWISLAWTADLEGGSRHLRVCLGEYLGFKNLMFVDFPTDWFERA